MALINMLSNLSYFSDLHKDKEIMARLEELKRRKRPSQSEEQPEDEAKPSGKTHINRISHIPAVQPITWRSHRANAKHA